jgi:hypothetical protein
MQNLETLMFNILFSVSLNIILQEIKSSLISKNWIVQIIVINWFFVISQKGANCFDT